MLLPLRIRVEMHIARRVVGWVSCQAAARFRVLVHLDGQAGL